MSEDMKAYRKKLSEHFNAQAEILNSGLDRPT